MRIVTPISAAAEIAPLAEAGADEFYCGIVPPDWTARFRSSGVNRRLFGNFATYAELEEATATAHDKGCSLSLVLNAPHYAAEQAEAAIELAYRFAAFGGDGLIVGDIGLLAQLAERGPGLRLHASSLLSCRNSEAAALYGEIGAHRVIFPRDITPAEMARVIVANPATEFEAFILNDGCVFEEGSCHTIHLPGRLGGPICLDGYQSAHARVDDQPLSPTETDALAANDEAHRRWLWYRFSCGFATTEDGLPFGPCGLCALPTLAAHGVTAVKIAGREGNTARKVKSVEMVRAVRDRIAAGETPAAITEHARGLRRRPDLCDSDYMCYYPEV